MLCSLWRVDNGQPFIKRATLVSNPDGSVSFQLPIGPDNPDDAIWGGQEPNIYGLRHDDPSEIPGQYQRATLEGNTATFCTRPEDTPMPYLVALGQVYPA